MVRQTLCCRRDLAALTDQACSGQRKNSASKGVSVNAGGGADRREAACRFCDQLFKGQGLTLVQRGKLIGLVFGYQWFDDLIDITPDDVVEFIQRQIDAVIGDAPLRKIIGTNTFGSVA